MRKEYDALIGQRFGRLIVLTRVSNYISPKGSQKKRYLCHCDCGNDIIVIKDSLIRNATKSCGCLLRETTQKRNRKYNLYDLSGKYGVGYTSNTNKPFYFDLEDYDLIKDYCWREEHISSDDKNRYIITKSNIYLHRIIMNPKHNEYIDHINHKPYDNRKSNLRICTQSQNMQNRNLQSNNNSGNTGVYWNETNQKWYAEIKINKQHIYLGCFLDKESAINARRNAEIKYFGEYRYKGVC